MRDMVNTLRLYCPSRCTGAASNYIYVLCLPPSQGDVCVDVYISHGLLCVNSTHAVSLVDTGHVGVGVFVSDRII